MKNLLNELIYIFLFSLIFFNNSLKSQNQTYKNSTTNILFLIDASGSMQQNDPDDLRKLASKVISLLLDKNTHISIIEFDSDAREILSWTSVQDKDIIFSSINKISNKGAFTDFLAGLKKANEKFEELPESDKKVLFLFTDGIFEPNPYSDEYSPYYLEYYRKTLHKNRKEKLLIYREEYLAKFKIVAYRKIMETVIPALQAKNVELFTIGLSHNVDKSFLEVIERKINNQSLIVHQFYADQPTQLPFIFINFLKYLDDKIIVYKKEGKVTTGINYSFNIDTYLRNVFFILFTEKPDVSINLFPSHEQAAEPIPQLHPNLKLFALQSWQKKWNYNFENGTGNFSAFVVGKSSIDLLVEGIKNAYNFPEEIRGKIRVLPKHINLQENSYLSYIIHSSDDKFFERNKATLKNQEFSFLFRPTISGSYEVEFVLHAFINGEELLPRASKKIRFSVRPALYIEPRIINLGSIGKGKQETINIKIYLSKRGQQKIEIKSKIIQFSRCEENIKNLSFFKPEEIVLQDGQPAVNNITFSVPEDACWGDFQGELLFSTQNGAFKDKIKFFIHVPSIWEYLTYSVLIILIFIIILLMVLTYLWGRLGKPNGVLEVLKTPIGIVIQNSYNLNKIKKKNLLSKMFNWRRNKISIGGNGADIPLPTLSKDIKIQLYFVRFSKGAFVSNLSLEELNIRVKIIKPDLPDNPYYLSSGQQIHIDHNTIIEFNNFKFKYLNF